MTRKQQALRRRFGGPVRTCIVCRRPQSQADCCRLVARAGKLVFDSSRRLPGRGFYVCRRNECLRRFLAGRCRVGRQRPTAVVLEPESRTALARLAGFALADDDDG